MRPLSIALLCNVLLAIPGVTRFVRAQERPSEETLFGAAPSADQAQPSETPAVTTPPGNPPDKSESNPPAEQAGASAPAAKPPSTATRDQAILGGAETPMFKEEAAPEDPLKIGGQLYLRTQTMGLEGQRVDRYAFSAPSLLDVFLDARPNDRVRGFVLGRMTYDPTLPASGGATTGIADMPATGSTSGSAPLSSLFSTQTRTPRVALDQLWLRFDVARTVFVTAGKQHVRWGTGHFWTPTDYLHLRHRNPLDIFDARTGTTMLKLHVPIESKAWNFYAYGVTESPDTTPRLAKIAGAARAELVLDTTELGLGAFVRDGQNPKLAADLSTGVGDFDFYGELALLDGSEIDRVRYVPDTMLPAANLGQIVDMLYPVYQQHGYKVQAVAGVSYSHKYNDNDTFTIGAEYFYNQLGYQQSDAYPGLMLPHAQTLQSPASFFYLGQHYAAVYATFPAPYSLDLHTFTLSTLSNLSDRSFITRLDYSLVVLTHLRFEAFVAGHYGRSNGEFRFGLNALDIGGVKLSRAPALIDLGLALRLAI